LEGGRDVREDGAIQLDIEICPIGESLAFHEGWMRGLGCQGLRRSGAFEKGTSLK